METSELNLESSKSTASKPRLRSVAYPSYTIESCLKLVDRIAKEFTTTIYTPKEAISSAVKLSGGAFLMQLSSCSQYGLLHIKQKEGYKPTERFIKISKPLPNENPQDALLECFKSPELYKKLIEQFNNSELPSLTGLANILERKYEIKGNAPAKAASVFLKNAAKVGVVSVGNVLKLDSVYVASEAEMIEDETEDEQAQEEGSKPLLLPASSNSQYIVPAPNSTLENIKEMPFFLDRNREAKLRLPSDFNDDDIRRIVKVLNAYLP
jgi:hypothetical protein